MSSFFPIAKKKYYPSFQSDINDIFDTLFPKWSDPVWATPRVLSKSMYVNSPPCNITKNDDGFELDLAIPGYCRDDFTIDIENDVLTVSMVGGHTDDIADDDYVAREYNYGSFARSWTLPENTETGNIAARYEAGILNVSVPVERKESAKRRIKVG